MYCEKCGAKLSDGSRFCESCGAPVEKQGEIPELEKKIMENMEDELILEMPEALRENREGPAENRPPHGGGERQPFYGGGENRPPHGTQAEHGPRGPRPEGAGGHKEPPSHGGGTEKKPSGKKKAVIITLICVIAALLIAVAVFIFVLMSPERKLSSYIEDRNWESAARVYEEKYAGSGKEQEADALLKEAVDEIFSEYEDGTIDYPAAKSHLTAIADFWGDGYADEAMERLRALYDSRESFAEAEEAMERGQYREAIGLYAQVSEEDSNYKKAQERLEDAKREYRSQVFSEADSREASGDYDGAVSLLEEALEVLPGDGELSEHKEQLESERETYRIQSALDEAGRYASSGNYFAAVQRLEEALAESPESAELSEAYDGYCQKYEEDILAKAEAALGADQNYEAALIVLEKAIDSLNGEYPDIEQDFREKHEEYVQAQLAQSAQENEMARIAGAWQGSKVISGGLTLSAEDFLLYGGMSGERLYMELRTDGSLYVDLLGQEETGTWEKASGENAYTLIIGGAGQEVTLETDGTMRMDLGEAAIIFAKAPSA